MKLLFLAGCLGAIDRLSKNYFMTKPASFQNSFLKLNFYKNHQHLFFPVNRSLLVLFPLVTAGLLLWSFKKKRRLFSAVGITLIITGGLSNFYDRAVFGYVVDWIALPFLPFCVFNLADVIITAGCLLTAVYLLKSRKEAKTANNKEIHCDAVKEK